MSTPSTPSPSGKDRPNWIERRLSRFMHQAPTVKNAALAIVAMTVFVVVGSGILMTIVDRSEYPNVWVGMWWALQTVTTVGYGDVTPQDPSGRLVATVVLLYAIAFLAVITAVVTSTFVARASRELALEQQDSREAREVDARLAEVLQRLDRIESALRARD
jgi:voltage-gated potassium channel Kch